MTKETVQHFNLQTMSGIFPGMRTPVFQRVRIHQLLEPQGEQGATPPPVTRWLQLAWDADPAACAAYPLRPGLPIDYGQPLFRLADPLAPDFNQRLQAALASQQQQLTTCGSCRFWQRSDVVTPGQLPTGYCGWPGAGAETADVPATLALQSFLALDCPHWQPANASTTASQPPSNADRRSLAPMRKVAESAEIRLSLWQRFKKRLMARLGRGQAHHWEALFLERSGVGAGTEPCFVCQGRIANLGALTVGTPEGDKQTFSVWRCRHCYTVYLNNWIDRWERLENLETEESYYRIAPAEAKELLTVIYSVIGGEHPKHRQEREAERAQVLTFMADRTPLSHQIRQGR